MKRLTFAFAVCVLAAAGHAVANSGRWTQIDEEDGIRVWRLDVPGQDLPGFRGQTTMRAPLSKIVDTLQNVSEHPEWMYRCAEAKTLRRFGEHHAVVYNRTDVPWPIWDRDVILETRMSSTEGGDVVTLTFEDYDPTLLPIPDRVVRMPRLAGFYRLEKLGPSQTRVLYQVEMDIGGSVPGRIANRVARDMPYETLSYLRERVASR